jgi:tetratricopeptide (TPR) repeat protein
MHSFTEEGPAMAPIVRLLPAAVALVASLASGRLLSAQSADVDEVKRVIRAETETYYQRDAEGWKGTWVQDSSAIRTFITSSSYSVALGWDRFGPSTVESIKHAAPQAVQVERTNYVVRIDGALAWAEYDERTTSPGDSVPLVARQQRTLVKRDGQWRILSAGSFVGSTYGTFPGAIESRLVGVGSDLAAAKRHRDAIEVLELNAQLHPSSWNAHAALGEAYAAAGDTRLAIQHYEKALAINPKNDAARMALAKLRQNKSP